MGKKFILELFRKSIYLIVPLLTLFISTFIYNKVTDGFNVNQIVSTTPTQFSIYLPEIKQERKEEIKKMLSQPFFYLGKGCQFYAFVSEDKKYVLKLLKQKHIRIRPWLGNVPFFKQKNARREGRVRNIFQSCEIAVKNLPSETGLIYCHFNKEPFLEKNITLMDHIGLPRPIYLDDFEFVLQEKGILLKEAFSLIKNNPEAIREKIGHLEKAVIGRLEKGILDRDRSFVQNIAFSVNEEKAIFIDFGQFYKAATITEEDIKRDVFKRLSNLRYWSERNLPELISYIDEKIKKYEKA